MVTLIATTANSLPGKLVSSLYEGQKEQMDLAIKAVQLVAEQQLALQQQQTTLQAVSILTGLGSKLNVFA
jgi:flagellin-specific chaperone FliS